MEWGTYKPNMFFGIKNRNPEPVTIGMAWIAPDEAKKTFNIRHTYRYQSGDGVTAYYQYHDGWGSSSQIIEDPLVNVKIQIDFIKQVTQEVLNEDITSEWKALITITKMNETKDIGTIPFIYLTYAKGNLNIQRKQEKQPKDEKDIPKVKLVKVTKQGNLPNEYELFEFANLSEESNAFNLLALNMQQTPIWDVEKYFKINMRALLLDQQTNEPDANLIVMRLGQLQQSETKFLISYKKMVYLSHTEALQDTLLGKQTHQQILKDFNEQSEQKYLKFNSKFEQVFGLSSKRFAEDDILKGFGENGLQMAKEALSNQLGGIGYYHGPLLIKKGSGAAYDEAQSLFTGCPSRSRFPRGFLWDEGFHLMVTCQWSPYLCMDILSHWFNTMKSNGWIPREQIRGPEAESAVPTDFIVQDPKVANPPSMMFPMKLLLKRAQQGDVQVQEFLVTLYDKWQKWYDWFFKSQENPTMPYTFSWRGRSSEENFPSGLDDYPRAFVVNEGFEIHLDLQSWMVEFSKFMSDYSTIVKDTAMQNRYSANAERIQKEMENKLYNHNLQLYCDYVGMQYEPKKMSNGYLGEAIDWRPDFQCGDFKNSLNEAAKCNHPYSANPDVNGRRCCAFNQCMNTKQCTCKGCQMHKSIDDDYSQKMLNQFSVHIGIVNMFPLMFGQISDSSKLSHTLSVLSDKDLMLGAAGIRSLSKGDQFYLYKSNYWRGAVWINVNFLVLKGLHSHYINDDTNKEVTYKQAKEGLVGDIHQYTNAQNIYQDIRKRIINTVYSNWNKNHIFWEQYDNESGKGLMTHPFTGWTTLILLIVSENYG